MLLFDGIYPKAAGCCRLAPGRQLYAHGQRRHPFFEKPRRAGLRFAQAPVLMAHWRGRPVAGRGRRGAA